MENSGKVIGALLVGVAVGIGLGILLAPDKGSKTRKKLFDGTQDLADDLKEKFKEGISKLRYVDEMAEEKVDDFVRTAKSKMDHHLKSKNGMS